MELHRQDAVIFRILRNKNGGWDVLKNEYENALAHFNDKQDACDYANRLSMANEGTAALVLDESTPASLDRGSTPQP